MGRRAYRCYFIIVFAVLCIPLLVGKIKAIKHEIDQADIFRDYKQ